MASNTTTIQTLPYGSDPTTPNTTFVQADPSNFRAVVQKLTGASDDPSAPKLPLTLPARLMAAQNHRPNSSSSTAAAADIGPKRPTFKLHERRHCTAKKLELNVGVSSGMIRSSTSTYYYNNCGLFYPSPPPPPSSNYYGGNRGAGGGIVMMGSPVSAFELAARGSPRTPKEEEEKAIAEKGFYLHPSPLNTPRGSDPPELLPLFPLHSPKQH